MPALAKDADTGADAATRRSVFVGATLASFLTPFMGSAINVALPTIGQSLHMDAVSMSWVATSYLLAAAIALVPAGRAADLVGRKKVFIVGMAVYTVASTLCACANTTALLILFRTVQGLGGAMIFGTGMAIVTSVFPLGDRGRILGYTISAVYLGLSLGPTVGGVLTQQVGWRSVFAINLPLGVFVIIYTLTRMKGEWRGEAGARFDFPGSIMYTLALLGLMYGLYRLPGSMGVGSVAAGCIALVMFVWWEARSRSPLLDVRLFKENRVFEFSNLAALINYAATFGVTFLMSLYLQYVKGMNAQSTGLILVAQPIVMALLSPFSGRASDRFEPRTVASLGMGITTIGLAALTLLGEGTPIGAIVGSLVVLGAGFALFSSPNANAVMSSVDRKFYGTASAVSGTMRLVGQTLSMGMVTVLLSLFVGRVVIVPSLFPALIVSTRVSFILFAVLCAFGVLASLTRGNLRKPVG